MNSNTAKYIVGNVMDCSGEFAIVFDWMFNHSDFRRQFTNILGAGFVTIDNNVVNCYGKSVTLGKDSREGEDTKVVKKSLWIE